MSKDKWNIVSKRKIFFFVLVELLSTSEEAILLYDVKTFRSWVSCVYFCEVL